VKNLFFISFFALNLSCTPHEYHDFITQKEIAERSFGPCVWNFVGFDSDLDNPALAVKPIIISDFVLWNQVCSRNR
tara:strand:+ start:278 stop:505 length:228 start_codon:yes stop_codon:yes gene_type:complete